MQKEKLEEIRLLFSRHMEAFQQEMGTLVSTPSPEDEQQIQEAITAVVERLRPEKIIGLGATLAELMEATAVKVLALTDSHEKKDRLLEVLSKHLEAQISEISETLTADLC
jgi:hypothetical protein